MCHYFENVSLFWKSDIILKVDQNFENGSTFGQVEIALKRWMRWGGGSHSWHSLLGRRERGAAAVQKETRIRSDLSRSQPSSAQHGQETWLPTASASAALLGSRFDLKQRETPISIQGLLKGSVSLVWLSAEILQILWLGSTGRWSCTNYTMPIFGPRDGVKKWI